MGGFQKRRADEARAVAGATADAPIISGPAQKRNKVALRVIKARQKAQNEKDAEVALQAKRWADLTEQVSDMSEKLEDQGNDASAEALAAVALKLAENAKNPPAGPQEDLAAPGLTDRVKSIIVDMFDAVRRTTEEPDFSDIVDRLASGDDDDDDDGDPDFGGDLDEDDISESIDPFVDESIAASVDAELAADMTDHTFDGQLLDVDVGGKAPANDHGHSHSHAPKAAAKKTAGKEETRVVVAGCCSSCSMGKGSCSSPMLAGDGVPGELIDGDIEGLFGPAVDDIDEDDVRAWDEDEFEENFGHPEDLFGG